jgi:hypothetical protein
MVLKCRIAALVLGILVVIGAFARVRADQPREFSGQLVSQQIPGAQVARYGVSSSLRTLSGNLTPFGPVTGYIQQNVDLATLRFVGYFALKSSRGTIYGYITGQLVPTDMTFQSFHVFEQVYLTGGTDKLSGLSGMGSGTGLALASGTSKEFDSGTFTLGKR